MYIKLTLNQLIRFKSFIGKIKRVSHYYSNSFNLIGAHNTVCVINVTSSLTTIREVVNIIKYICMTKGYVFFASQLPHHALLVTKFAKSVGQPYAVKAWIAGLISNHRWFLKMQIQENKIKVDEEWMDLVFKNFISKHTFHHLTDAWLSPLPPEFTFVGSSRFGTGPISESYFTKIPTMSVADTDSISAYSDFPVFGGDLLSDSIYVYISLLSKACILGQLAYIRNFLNIKNILEETRSSLTTLAIVEKLVRDMRKGFLIHKRLKLKEIKKKTEVKNFFSRFSGRKFRKKIRGMYFRNKVIQAKNKLWNKLNKEWSIFLKIVNYFNNRFRIELFNKVSLALKKHIYINAGKAYFYGINFKANYKARQLRVKGEHGISFEPIKKILKDKFLDARAYRYMPEKIFKEIFYPKKYFPRTISGPGATRAVPKIQINSFLNKKFKNKQFNNFLIKKKIKNVLTSRFSKNMPVSIDKRIIKEVKIKKIKMKWWNNWNSWRNKFKKKVEKIAMYFYILKKKNINNLLAFNNYLQNSIVELNHSLLLNKMSGKKTFNTNYFKEKLSSSTKNKQKKFKQEITEKKLPPINLKDYLPIEEHGSNLIDGLTKEEFNKKMSYAFEAYDHAHLLWRRKKRKRAEIAEKEARVGWRKKTSKKKNFILKLHTQ